MSDRLVIVIGALGNQIPQPMLYGLPLVSGNAYHSTMPQIEESKVYILGAGCSKHCGYPLGPEMRDELEQFALSLDPATSPRLLKAVTDTLELMAGTTETIDILVQKLFGGTFDHVLGGRQNVFRRAASATLAASAALLEKEPSARKTGFRRYREFISDLFSGAETNWLAMPQPNHCHVLTFNYDRLFEIAFLDRFNISGYGLYDVRVLNSGLTLSGKIDFKPESFSFLKLHGTVCGWTNDWTGRGHPQHQICHFETPSADQAIAVNDDFFFAEPPDGRHPDFLKRPPLLYFPYERQFIVSNDSGFAFHNYVRAVWDRAQQLIANASEIRVIGYSFSGIDRGPILDLLAGARNCRRLVIQSPEADEISSRIKLDRPQFEKAILSAPMLF